jgi:energy-coupling factor transporter ATP-binding protein EcfA2
LFDQKTYCPYTGLRSFTEEEAIYFKGRDQHIEEASQQLEDRKFLMLTGSSGDGKSSLVYAGIVPYARSGFIKSQFSNWLVADFKPERKPFKNLCESLASMLGIPSVSTVEAELSHGYSSLVELYKNSNFYNTIDGNEGQEYNEKEKTNLRRQSANLLILADQFEEFFTNPENYFNGKVSQESSLVINLLLETARIAQEENLPIYVVCTMRSDYIGHCSAFRDLPEFIGYSQFFVPRLNRKQLQEVIEEPALLSGNSISRRLVQRLIYDITEGVDQLPILQHALNQIWRAAENGKEEMDLIHYAMVGGIKGNELPHGDQNKFESWFNELPEKIQACYEHHSLQNVLNTHANKLYATAAEYYNQKNKDNLNEEDVNHLIQNVFVCLTKIDHGRAVRNRMTLSEISEITDIDGLTSEKLKNLTAIFRDPNNTLIQPFIDEDGNDPLGEEDLLDISHESLIRNWNSLKSWASEEFNHVNTYRDYKHQVDRWIEHNRSSDYLLPIGTLTHFEDWFKKIEPNKYWINRYNQEIEDKEKRLLVSEEILDDCNKYLKASGQKHIITRSVMKLGALKIAAALGIMAILLFSSFYIYEEYSKSEEIISNKILSEGIELLNDVNAGLNVKSGFIIEMTRADKDNFDLIFSELDPHRSLEISLMVSEDLLYRYQHRKHFLIDRSIHIADAMLDTLYNNDLDSVPVNQFLKDHDGLLYTLDVLQYFQPSKEWEAMIKKHATHLADYIITNLESPEDFNPEAIHLNNSFELILNNNAWNSQQIATLLNHISPLENDYSGKMSKYFESDNTMRIGRVNSDLSHNGLYQELAYLYADNGNVSKTLNCIDTLLKYNQSYFIKDYNLLQDNATNISAYFLINNDLEGLDRFIDGYCLKSGISRIDFLDKLAGRSIFSIRTGEKSINSNASYLHNLNLGLMEDATRLKIFDLYEDEIMKIKNPDNRNFKLALLYKHKAMFIAQKQILSTGTYDKNSIQPLYSKAVQYYKQVFDSHLEESVDRMQWSSRVIKSKRKAQFIFPGYLEYQNIWVPRAYGYHYMNTSFIEYLANNELVNELFNDQDDINNISEWTSYIVNVKGISQFTPAEAILDFEALSNFIHQINKNLNFSKEELTSLKVLTAINLFRSEKNDEAIKVVEKIEFDNLQASIQDITNAIINMKFLNIGILAYYLKSNGESETFEKIIDAFDLPVNKSSLLAYIASQLGINNKIEECRELLARAKIEESKRESANPSSVARIAVANVVLPDMEGYSEARRLWKNFPNKNFLDNYIASHLSTVGFAWRSYEDIEKLTPAQGRLVRYTRIGGGIRKHKNLNEIEEWQFYDSTNSWWWNGIFYSNN